MPWGRLININEVLDRFKLILQQPDHHPFKDRSAKVSGLLPVAVYELILRSAWRNPRKKLSLRFMWGSVEDDQRAEAPLLQRKAERARLV